jgi:hypothetical protein
MNNTIKFVAVCVAAPVMALGVGAPAAWTNIDIDNGVASTSTLSMPELTLAPEPPRPPNHIDIPPPGDHGIDVKIEPLQPKHHIPR